MAAMLADLQQDENMDISSSQVTQHQLTSAHQTISQVTARQTSGQSLPYFGNCTIGTLNINIVKK
jgi:hypothetical protein